MVQRCRQLEDLLFALTSHPEFVSVCRGGLGPSVSCGLE